MKQVNIPQKSQARVVIAPRLKRVRQVLDRNGNVIKTTEQ